MATNVASSLAKSLYNALNKFQYCKYVHYLGLADGYSRQEFWNSDLLAKYWLNIGPVFKNNTIDNDHVFNIFERYSDDDAATVRRNLGADVTDNLDYYQKALFVVTQMKSNNVVNWLEDQFLNEKCGDEWTVFCLSRLYNQHTMIHNKKHSLCTIEEGLNINYEMECDTHLLYMGNNMFRELLLKSVTKLGRIPNLLLSSPPIQKTPALAKDIDTGTDIIDNADPAEFPNSVLDNTPPVTATPRVHTEDPDYNKDLDTVLLASTKSGKLKSTCPVNPQCITNIGNKPTSPICQN